MSLKPIFEAYSKFGNKNSDGKTITLTNSDKWLKEAGVIDKNLTTTDTSIEFKKFKAKALDLKQFEAYIEALARAKKIDPKTIIEKLLKCSVPGTAQATKAVQNAAVDRLTDTSKYTGSHKERFDAEGRGRGIEGRADTSTADGYVQGYKHKDTYKDKKLKGSLSNT